jgi:hypothetical protein
MPTALRADFDALRLRAAARKTKGFVNLITRGE